MLDDQDRLWCDRCAGPIPEDGRGGYMVRIEVLADPKPAPLQANLSREEIRRQIRRTIRELSKLSGQEAMDQVYRRFDFVICPACQRTFIEDPLNRDGAGGR